MITINIHPIAGRTHTEAGPIAAVPVSLKVGKASSGTLNLYIPSTGDDEDNDFRNNLRPRARELTAHIAEMDDPKAAYEELKRVANVEWEKHIHGK